LPSQSRAKLLKVSTVKGFISFAAQKSQRKGERPKAAKVMKPFGELNGGVRPGL
jgi:hypothetical protein